MPPRFVLSARYFQMERDKSVLDAAKQRLGSRTPGQVTQNTLAVFLPFQINAFAGLQIRNYRRFAVQIYRFFSYKLIFKKRKIPAVRPPCRIILI